MTLQSPEFIIIGAMKSATSSLQEQLLEQPGIFMCTPKEPNYFSDDDQYQKGEDWYQGLFSEAPPGSLRGEASTHYTKLPTYPKTVERLQKHLPNLRMIYVMRHPVDRLISHYMHEWSMGNINMDINRAVKFHPELISYSKYSIQLKPYFEAYSQTAILPVFFDRLLKFPQSELERVCRFIGYKNSPNWKYDLKPSNISSERLRKFPLFNLLVKSKPATWLRRNLVPQSFRDQIKSRLVLRQRPILSEATQLQLEHEFDTDLSILGSWLGTKLNCRNFKNITADSELNWIDCDGR